ncbi:MAG: STAS domain-containing protein [Actinomycetota bacterium]|nr:STAS domain-containing protein [Actinomycetota bacterium]
MRAHQHAAPLVVVRSEDESGRVGLRLIGELDLNTVGLLAEELRHTREHSPPSVIDLSELRFLDLTGLRMLQRAATSQDEVSTRLVGATGIVRRTIELAHMLDAETARALGQPLASKPTTRVAAQQHEATFSSSRTHVKAGRRVA